LSVRPPRAAPWAEYCPALFFKPATRRGQIRRVDQRHSGQGWVQTPDQRFEQMAVDLPKTAHAQLVAEGVHHPHIGQQGQAPQTGKMPPRFLLRQHSDEQIEGMNRSQQDQQVQAPQLGGAQMMAPAAGLEPWPAFIQKVIRDEGRQQLQKLLGACGWQLRFHVARRLPKNRAAVRLENEIENDRR